MLEQIDVEQEYQAQDEQDEGEAVGAVHVRIVGGLSACPSPSIRPGTLAPWVKSPYLSPNSRKPPPEH